MSNVRIAPTRMLGAVMYRWHCNGCGDASRRYRSNEHALNGARVHRCGTAKPAAPRPMSAAMMSREM